MEKLKLGLKEITEASGESLNVVYNAINCGHLQTFVVGRRRFARPDAVRKWVDFLQAESDAGRPVKYRPRSSERAERTAA
jgi:hypothetical protein